MIEEIGGKVDERFKKLIRNCIIFSLVTHLICAWFINWIYHADELFQILEFGGYKLGFIPAQSLPWEFPAKIRPALQPAMVYVVGKLTGNPVDPILTAFILRMFTTIIGWLSLTFITLISLNWVKSIEAKRALLYSYASLWFLPYLHANFSSESLSGSLFFAGLGCLWMGNHLSQSPPGPVIRTGRKDAKEKQSQKSEIYWLLAAGFLLGLAFVSRVQTGFLIAGLMFWCIFLHRFSFKKIIIIFIPAALAVAIGFVIDSWFYGEWVNTAWNYYKANIIQGIANNYGVFPWWDYLLWSFNVMIPPLGLVVMIGVFYAIVKFPRNIVIVSVIPFVFIHFVISHKESRFLFPLIDAVPVCLALTFSSWQALFDKRRKLSISLGKIFVGFNVICIVVLLLKPQQQPYDLYKVVHDKYWNSGAYMFCTSDDPYSFIGLVVNYYKPNNFTFYSELRGKNIDSTMANTHTGTHPVLMFFDREHDEYDFIKRHPEAKRIYTSIPDWMHWVNVNNWISRTLKLSLYEMPGKAH